MHKVRKKKFTENKLLNPINCVAGVSLEHSFGE